MIPDQGMPPKWSEAFKEIAEERVGKKLKTAAKAKGTGRSLITPESLVPVHRASPDASRISPRFSRRSRSVLKRKRNPELIR
jgi:hypothetical protein